MKKITSLFFVLISFVIAYAQPTNNATSPTNNAVDVISIYSDVYNDVATNYNPGWGQSGSVNDAYDPGTGDLVMAYTNFNYQGTDLTTQNAAAMEYLHIDVWTNANPMNTVLQVSPINNGTGAGEFLVTINYTSGSWYSVDIPKSAFTGMTWDAVFQLKFAANGPGSTVPVDIYLDNIYFWKTPIAAGSDATLSDLKVDGTTVAGFSPSTIDYTYPLPNGTTVIPQITMATASDANATSVTITQATALPGSATVVVVSQNGNVTKTYTVAYVLQGPNVAAPTPPARDPSDVISLFSNAYSNVTIGTWNAAWDVATSSDVMIDGNDTKKITGLGYLGVEFIANRIDASAFTNFHMDFWTDDANLVGKVFNSKFSQWGGTSSEVSAIELNLNDGTTPAVTNGVWVSVDVPITNFTNSPQVRDDLAQFVITSNLTGPVFIDNIYFYKGTPLNSSQFDVANFKVYPNPAQNVWNIVGSKNIVSIEIFDLLGKRVKVISPNATEVMINASELSNGVYLANVSTDNETEIVKLVKR